MTNDTEQFLADRLFHIDKQGKDRALKEMSLRFMSETVLHKYSYNFDWLGLPIIQYPQDILAVQEIIWKVKPDLIIETGVARGGSLILSASILHLINGNGKVLGIDIDIRAHNRKAIEAHPLSSRIQLMEGSSTDEKVIANIKKLILPSSKVLVILDSNHTHEHVLKELELYSPFVTKNSYLIVMDTVIEDIPACTVPNRSWSQTDNPKTAVREFLKTNKRFIVDHEIQNKLLITVAPNGYLKCVQ